MPLENMPVVNGQYMIDKTADLCRIPSPTGFTADAVAYVAAELDKLGIASWRTVKGALVAKLPGEQSCAGRLLSAHVDTLGAMVREVKANGRLRLSMIGGYDWNTIEGEYCLVHGSKEAISGTILTTKAAFHVYGKAQVDLKRDEFTIEVRLDAPVSSREEVAELGIGVGDFVSLDPRTTVLENGFIKSRHLDDKACVAILLGVAKAVVEERVALIAPSYLYVSTYEEVGHGTSAGLPDGLEEVIAVDMAAIGEGQTSTEFAATICVKDSTGPYDHALSRRLIELAKRHGIDHRVDIYNYYGSDVSQALRAGYDIRGGLVGPGVDSSHSFERLHRSSLEETAKLLLAYLSS